MGSLQRLPRAQRRAQLLATAIEQFAMHGYHRTSMESIASAVGVTKPVLYQHFDSKEDLYLEVVRVVGSKMVEELDALGSLGGDTYSRVAHGLRSFTEILVNSGTSLRVLDTSEVVSDEVSEVVEEILDRSALSIANILVRSRELSQSDAEVLGRALTAMARASASQLADAGTEEERAHITDLLTLFAANGMRSFPALESPRIAGRVTGAYSSS